jgi:hypothetical protein
MRIIVCGSRYAKPEAARRIAQILDWLAEEVPGPHTLIEGDAPGVDRLAGGVGQKRGWGVIAVPAEWSKNGRAAGPIRNQRMLDENPTINAVVAFPAMPINYDRSGTMDMVKRALNAGIPALVFPLSAELVHREGE